MKAREQGFTILELLVVLFIIGLLSALVIPQFTAYANTAQWQINDPNDEWEIGPVSLGLFWAKTPEQALECMQEHEKARWDPPQIPQACQRNVGVRGYTLKNIKKAIEKQACQFGWQRPNVHRVINGKTVISSEYKITSDMCES